MCVYTMYLTFTFRQNVRWLLDNKYTAEPSGLPGNDDYGEYM